MRLFVAIGVPEEAKAKIAEAAAALSGSGARMLPHGNLHITLKFIGEAGENGAREIEEALASVSFAPFVVKLRGAGAFPSEKFPRAIWIGGESGGAEELAANVEAALAFLHFPKDKPFSLHLTVARSGGGADAGEFLRNTGDVAKFEVRSFFLMKSELAPSGAKYLVAREYPAGRD